MNKKELKEYFKEYRRTHKKERKEYKRVYDMKHKKEIKEYDLKYKQRKKIYRYNNKNKIALYMRKYRKILNNKIKTNLRYRVWSVLKGVSKSKSTMQLVGCSIKFLIKYLELRFMKDMSWHNYGLYGWHIDHIIPCASFDLSKPEEQRKCFHYTNLQPLWAFDNLSKNDKIIKPQRKE
jgi:hypothetical protein